MQSIGEHIESLRVAFVEIEGKLDHALNDTDDFLKGIEKLIDSLERHNQICRNVIQTHGLTHQRLDLISRETAEIKRLVNELSKKE
jgi:hypothetical protein